MNIIKGLGLSVLLASSFTVNADVGSKGMTEEEGRQVFIYSLCESLSDRMDNFDLSIAWRHKVVRTYQQAGMDYFDAKIKAGNTHKVAEAQLDVAIHKIWIGTNGVSKYEIHQEIYNNECSL